MNLKLLIFIVLIGFKSIDSSIIKHELIDSKSFVKIDGLNIDDEKDPFNEVKELTFNISETVKNGSSVYKQIECINYPPDNICTLGNGKYQAKFVRCVNINYGTGKNLDFECVHSGHRATNKNLFVASRSVRCFDIKKDDLKQKCIYRYSWSKYREFTEDDDVEEQ